MKFILNLNEKEVQVKEVLFKHIRNLILYNNSALRGHIEFLEKFILSKELNVAEKFKVFLILREKCIGENISVGSNKGNINISLDYINNNIGSFDDIETTVSIGNLDVTLDYPYEFNLGDSDFLFSCIKSLKLDGETIILQNLEQEERNQVLGKLPKEVFDYITDFVQKNHHNFKFTVIEDRKNLDIKKIELDLLTVSAPMFIYNIFNCMSGTEYRELLFVLSKRVHDIEFLLNSNYLEVEDFYNLYKDEVEKENENLQNQNKQ